MLPSRTPRSMVVRVCAVAFVSATMALSLACENGDDAPPATPTVTSTIGPPTATPPPPTPTPLPADPEAGARLRSEGEYEQAIEVYASIAGTSAGEQRLRALLSQAQLLVRTGRAADAVAPLETYLQETPVSEADASAARYLLASVQQDAGQHEASLGNYARYASAGGVLAPFARVEQARLLAALQRPAEAEEAAEGVLASELPASSKPSFTLSMGTAFSRAGDQPRALAWFQRAGVMGADEAAALAGAGRARRALGDPAWTADMVAVIERFPATGTALDALAALDEASVPVSPFARGLVYYRNFRNQLARESLGRAAAAGDRAAQATYYLGAIDERQGDNAAAIDNYAQSYALDPASPQADDALWWRGRLLELSERYDEAGDAYAAVVERFPGSQFAADAEFRRGMALYRSGQRAAAAFAWGTAASAGDASERARALFWQGRAERAADLPQADQTLRAVIAAAPGDFYALRAQTLLGENADGSGDVQLDRRVQWDTAASELLGVRPSAGVDGRADVENDARWVLAAALRDVELNGQADRLYVSLIDQYEADPGAMLAIARRFETEGNVAMSARTAARLLATLPDDAALPEIRRAAYPPAFADLVLEASREWDVDPLLLLALVRQESFYDPLAGSTAGALGLTQVIEPTGRAIADALGVADFEVSDLYRPRLSLRFGAKYLADQIEAFDGNIYHAMAAYNGGPGTASDAIDSAGDDLDLFVEDLEFEETQRYVRLVSEHYARYRELYGGAGRPSLPR